MRAAADMWVFAVIAVAYVTSVVVYSALPEGMGAVAALFRPGLVRPMIAFLLPSVAAAVYVLLGSLAVHNPFSGEKTVELRPPYSEIVCAIVLFVLGLHGIVLFGLLASPGVVSRAVPLLLGLFFAAVGNLLPRTRPNPLIGMRTSATLENRDVWMRVNRFVAYVTVSFGSALVASAFLTPGRTARDVVSVVATVSLVVLGIGYWQHAAPIAGATSMRSRHIGRTGWLLRVPLVLVFLYFGAIKFSNHPESPWPKLFAEIGLGQWFRYFTGALEVAGGILLLIPRTSRSAAAALACTMAGAILTHMFIVRASPAIFLPVVLLVVLIVIVAKGQTGSE